MTPASPTPESALHAPVHCRPSAYELFAAEVRDPERPDALLRAAVAVAKHELEDADPDAVVRQIDALAARVHARVRSGHERAYLAHLHHVLFEEEGFQGSATDYHHPRNSYLPVVLLRRRGLPITLALVYKAVAERLGLTVYGVNAPGHFLASVDTASGRLLVDPFAAGRVLNREEAFERMERAMGGTIQRTDLFLREATSRQWLARLLRNLQAVFAHQGRESDHRAMLEMRAVLLAPR